MKGQATDWKEIFAKHMRDSLVAQMVKNPPAVWEPWVQSLNWEDLLEKEMATHFSIRIPWTEEPGRLHSPWDRKESDMTEQLSPSYNIYGTLRTQQ